ncbi:MAG: sigma-70 family RNA polymerase sigma factor [Planctomycetota bacterium]|nr:MAG: sigma-70 family RNA polymerase sigma factor [Planctomycetota bacterium]
MKKNRFGPDHGRPVDEGMSESVESIDLSKTSTGLLLALFAEKDSLAWGEFDRRFRPVLVGLGSRLGLGPEDAADAAQETLLQFYRDYLQNKFSRDKGKLRNWLLRISRNRILDMIRVRKRLPGETPFHSVEPILDNSEALDVLWEREFQQAILRESLNRLFSKSRISRNNLDIFRLCMQEKKSADQIAFDLNLTPEAVYRAKHRCTQKLKEIMREVEQSYEL